MIFYYIANTVERYAEKKKKKQITRGMTDNNITFYQPMINENNQLINENNQLINENNNEGYITFFIRCWKPRNILKKIAI